MKAIVAMVALDERDAAVLAAVRAVVARVPARVVLVHAADGPPAAAEARVRALAQELGATVRVRPGEVHAVATEALAEEQGELLVFGRNAGGRDAWGENGKALLRSAGCPILVAPAGAPIAAFRRAAVGMDLSPASLDALALAARLADTVEALAVLSPEDAHAAPEAVTGAVRARFVAEAASRGLPPVPLRAVIGRSPADALLDAAEVDLLAVGSRGLSPLATVFLGSTAERIARRSPRPVLVIRRHGEARGLLGALFGS